MLAVNPQRNVDVDDSFPPCFRCVSGSPDADEAAAVLIHVEQLHLIPQFHEDVTFWKWGGGAAGLFESRAPRSRCSSWIAHISNPITIPVKCYSCPGSITTHLNGT